MKYIVINLYDGTNTVETELDGDAFFGMVRVEGEGAIVWQGEETMIVQIKE